MISDNENSSDSVTAKENKNIKYKTALCNQNMTEVECELAILQNAVSESEALEAVRQVNDPQIKKMLHILEGFLRKGKNICYGGIALNAVLPKKMKFYDFDSELPDYDFFSRDALKDAIDLCDLYHRAGFKDVEGRSGVNHGTFKVFVNYIAIADITQMDTVFFDNLLKESIKIKNIYYSSIHFLRMALYIELSRPKGDISRWEKVFKRLTLLNHYYPLKSEIPCELVNIQRSMTRVSVVENSLKNLTRDSGSDKNMQEKLSKTLKERKDEQTKIYRIVLDILIQKGVVFFGGYAASLYADRMPEEKRQWVQQIPDFDVLYDKNIEECAQAVVKGLKKAGYEGVKMIENPALGKYIPRNFQIVLFEKDAVCFIHETTACHSYNTISKGGKKINVATIDTILSLYLAFIYSGKDYIYRERILCISQYLFEVEQENRLEQTGILKRFTMECIGKQKSLINILEEKSAKFEALKNQKTSLEYNSWFFKYNPAKDKHPKIVDNVGLESVHKTRGRKYDFGKKRRTTKSENKRHNQKTKKIRKEYLIRYE
jgi:hypothetical protein